MRYIITAKHENGHEMKQTRYSKEDVERTINLMKQCGYIEITMEQQKDEAEVKKLENGNLAFRWVGETEFFEVDMKTEQEIGILLIALMAGVEV